MLLKIRVIPNSKHTSVELLENGRYKVKVREKAELGKANLAVIRAIAGYFNVKEDSVRITSGATTSNKTIEVFGVNQGNEYDPK